LGKCDQYIQNINDYLDGEADESFCQELEQHLKGCKNCRIMVDTLKQTVVLCRDGKKEKLPDEITSKLTAKLKQKWQSKFNKSE
jgi:anti-sigma factor (TIGR02949 family)